MSDWPRIKKTKIIDNFFINSKNTKYFKRIFNKDYPNNIFWDRAWFLTNIINDRLTIIPDKNLVTNIGFDDRASGPNPKKYNSIERENLEFPLKHPKILTADTDADQFLINEGFSIPKLQYRIINKLKKIFSFLLK